MKPEETTWQNTLGLRLEFSETPERAHVDARLDTIYASVRNFSRVDVYRRIRRIDMLLEGETEPGVLEAIVHMENLNKRLQLFGERRRGAAYREARGHLLSAWRFVMHGDYEGARRYLGFAADCCSEMA
jgi:hypothetical protein